MYLSKVSSNETQRLCRIIFLMMLCRRRTREQQPNIQDSCHGARMNTYTSTSWIPFFFLNAQSVTTLAGLFFFFFCHAFKTAWPYTGMSANASSHGRLFGNPRLANANYSPRPILIRRALYEGVGIFLLKLRDFINRTHEPGKGHVALVRLKATTRLDVLVNVQEVDAPTTHNYLGNWQLSQ